MDISAQPSEWKMKTYDNGNIVVNYSVEELTDENGKKVPLMQYSAVTIDSLSMQKCISVLSDVPKHKIFLAEGSSEILKTVSDTDWIVYYYYNPIWPFPKSDCVARMTMSKNDLNTTAIFSLTAAPTLYKERNIERFTLYDLTYEFNDLGNGLVEVKTTTKMIPAIPVPLWLVKVACPSGAKGILKRLVNLIKKS
ncbi:MAG: hypothetical protein K9M55_02580 [Candidatus Marinimicrobia bacterium]|nr:hypothetical protein [Candidatus Neomarinimicrobiota bacterium]